ncbi:hypothetical protein KAR48_06340 [bacterium]|nr:hypothetical protein [bacterium]
MNTSNNIQPWRIFPFIFCLFITSLTCNKGDASLNPFGDDDANPTQAEVKADTLYAVKDASIYLNNNFSVNGYDSWTEENSQDFNYIGTDGWIAGDWAAYQFYATAIYFGDIRSAIQARAKTVKNAYIQFYCTAQPSTVWDPFSVYITEFTTSTWSETTIKPSTAPQVYSSSEFQCSVLYQGDVVNIDIRASVDRILKNNVKHGGFLFAAKVNVPRVGNCYIFLTRENGMKNKRPKLIIEYDS